MPAMPGVSNGISDITEADSQSAQRQATRAGGRYPRVGPRGVNGRPQVSYALPDSPTQPMSQVPADQAGGFANLTQPAAPAPAAPSAELPQGAEGEAAAAGVSGLDFQHVITHEAADGTNHRITIKGKAPADGISGLAKAQPSWEEFYRGMVTQGGRNSYSGRIAGQAVDRIDANRTAQAQQEAAQAAGGPPQISMQTDVNGNVIYAARGKDVKLGHVAPPALASGAPGHVMFDRHGNVVGTVPALPEKRIATDKPIFNPVTQQWDTPPAPPVSVTAPPAAGSVVTSAWGGQPHVVPQAKGARGEADQGPAVHWNGMLGVRAQNTDGSIRYNWRPLPSNGISIPVVQSDGTTKNQVVGGNGQDYTKQLPAYKPPAAPGVSGAPAADTTYGGAPVVDTTAPVQIDRPAPGITLQAGGSGSGATVREVPMDQPPTTSTAGAPAAENTYKMIRAENGAARPFAHSPAPVEGAEWSPTRGWVILKPGGDRSKPEHWLSVQTVKLHAGANTGATGASADETALAGKG